MVEVDEKEGLGLAGSAGNPISLGPNLKMSVAKKVKKIIFEKMDAASQGVGVVESDDDEDDPFAVGVDERAFWQEVIALDPISQGVDANLPPADFVDLSSSESGDDGDDDMGDIAEEHEEIITTLSSEDVALLAEVITAIKGTKPFHVMRPLKIKGRNLYRIQTLRQPWLNETERQKVLDEKHARGAEARAHRRAMRSLKSRGRAKSRQEARVHPYLRSHTIELHSTPPAIFSQNSVRYGSIHTQNNVYQGSVPEILAPSMQHGTYTERAVYQSFTERYPVPETNSTSCKEFP